MPFEAFNSISFSARTMKAQPKIPVALAAESYINSSLEQYSYINEKIIFIIIIIITLMRV